MEPDDLLCSRNARSRAPLVGRTQWEINSLHPQRERADRPHFITPRAITCRLVPSPSAATASHPVERERLIACL
jgi:hypothetical protein